MQNKFEDADEVLLLFDSQYPCWNVAMFELSGVSLGTIATLRKRGLLDCEGKIYFLSDVGHKRFETLARQLYLPSAPGKPTIDRGTATTIEGIERTAFACELKLLLDKRHVQRWGLKEYELPFTVSIPNLSPQEIFRLSSGHVEWLWPEHPVFTTLRTTSLAVNCAVVSPLSADVWLTANSSSRVRDVKFDLLYKSRYDFQMYTQFKPIPTDKYGFFNVDRFLFSIPTTGHQDDLNFYLMRIGEFQMFFDLVRHIYLPDFTDHDALEQDCVNWMLFAFATEKEAQVCVELLCPFRKDFDSYVTDTTPTEIWSVSLEGLKNYPESTVETIWDLLPFAAHPIYRIE